MHNVNKGKYRSFVLTMSGPVQWRYMDFEASKMTGKSTVSFTINSNVLQENYRNCVLPAFMRVIHQNSPLKWLVMRKISPCHDTKMTYGAFQYKTPFCKNARSDNFILTMEIPLQEKVFHIVKWGPPWFIRVRYCYCDANWRGWQLQ